MTKFNTGAARLLPDAARMAAANDLVRRTLAQHGLMPEAAGAADHIPPQGSFPGLAVRPFGKQPQPAPIPDGARFEAGRFTCKAGSRDHMTYVPASAANGAQGVVLMLHGCTQNPRDFAAGTRMNDLAEDHRLIIVYPEQARGENGQGCWNWFTAANQRRDRGEPAILAALAAQIAADHAVPPARVFAAGLSAGAAMAVILGQTYPDVFSAVGAHSGLPHGAAGDVPSAFQAMAGTAQARPEKLGARHAVPTITFHGSADHTVNPANSDRIAADMLVAAPRQTLAQTRQGQSNGRGYNCQITTDMAGKPLIEQWTVDGLGHAWSGGDRAGSYADPAGPSASAEMVRFFLSVADGQD